MIQERRHFDRVGLDSHLLVLLAESKYGLLADLCQDGLAADVLTARSLGETIPFSFYLPEKSNCIQGRAEIVWINDFGESRGMEANRRREGGYSTERRHRRNSCPSESDCRGQ